jgi:hypothetical protein
MSVRYINRMGRTYYLMKGKTRTGKPRYWFAAEPGSAPAEAVPAGYEIYERPENGQVLLRRARAQPIGDLEKRTVEEGMRKCACLPHFVVSIEDDSIVVYLPDLDASEASRLVESFRPAAGPGAVEKRVRRSRYSRMMRFVLADAARRKFTAQRWCFRGSIDGWTFLAGPADLPGLVRKYGPHLGRESFFDLS